MFRRVLTTAAVLIVASGCVVHSHGRAVASGESSGSGSGSGNEPKRRPPRPHVPAKPSHGDDAKPEPKPAKPVPDKPEPRPDPPVTKPEPKPPVTKPEPKPPVTKPEPKPPVAKPEPEPEPPKPPFKPTPEPPKERPPKPVQDVTFGMPSDLKPGQAIAFWIWQDDTGWHLRTTGKGSEPHRFTGRIWVKEGAVMDPTSVTVEGKDRIRTTRNSIEVDFMTLPRIDGIDWKFSGAKCVNFKLLVDEKEQPKHILLGAKKVHPPTASFAICPDDGKPRPTGAMDGLLGEQLDRLVLLAPRESLAPFAWVPAVWPALAPKYRSVELLDRSLLASSTVWPG